MTRSDFTSDDLWPRDFDRETEERLVRLVASGSLSPDVWRREGSDFFVAGLAMMMAATLPVDPGYRELAERLHPGMSEVPVFQRWLDQTPVSPSRFLPMLRYSADAPTSIV